MPPQPSEAPRPSARRAILNATEDLLLEVGWERLSIRRLSERCGYSAPTIYHHFGDKTGLIDQLLEERFRKLLNRLRRVARGDDPAEYLRELARTFVRFGVENAEHYQLLTNSRTGSDGVLPSAAAARELVAGAFEELARRGALATDDLEGAFLSSWALLHGLISLQISRPAYPRSEKLLEIALQMMEHGLLKQEASGA